MSSETTSISAYLQSILSQLELEGRERKAWCSILLLVTRTSRLGADARADRGNRLTRSRGQARCLCLLGSVRVSQDAGADELEVHVVTVSVKFLAIFFPDIGDLHLSS